MRRDQEQQHHISEPARTANSTERSIIATFRALVANEGMSGRQLQERMLDARPLQGFANEGATLDRYVAVVATEDKGDLAFDVFCALERVVWTWRT